MPVILATQEAEIRDHSFKPAQANCETLSQNTLHKKRAGGVAQGVGSKFKSQYQTKKRNGLSLFI
jgi:hypothetical protein